jgi:hypothetical protein
VLKLLTGFKVVQVNVLVTFVLSNLEVMDVLNVRVKSLNFLFLVYLLQIIYLSYLLDNIRLHITELDNKQLVTSFHKFCN